MCIIKDFFELVKDLIIFFLGILVAYISSRWKENKQNKKLIKYFENFIVKLKKSTQIFKNQLEKAKKQLQENVTLQLDTQRIQLLPFHIYDSLNKIDLHAAFESKYNEKKWDFFELTTSIEFIRKTHEQYLNNKKSFNNQFQPLGTQWNERMVLFNSTKNSIFTKTPYEQIEANPDLIFLNDTYNNWYLSKDTSIHGTKTILLDPLEEYFKKVLSVNHENKNAIEILRVTQGLLFTFDHIQQLFKQHAKLINEIIIGIDKELERM